MAVPPAHSGFSQPSLDFSYLYAADQQISPTTTSHSDLTLVAEPFIATQPHKLPSADPSPRPLKKQRPQNLPQPAAARARKSSQQSSRTMSDVDPAQAVPPVEPPAATKPKRVRTGCLTCRERHLKCDEAMPHCQNCRKSNRICKRGIRLNFIDTTVQAPPVVPPSQDWNISFLDESRDIASEYKGGLSKYGAPEVQATTQAMNGLQLDFSSGPPPAPELSHQPLPPIQGVLPDMYADDHNNMMYETSQPPSNQHVQHTGMDFSAPNSIQAASAYNSHEPTTSPPARPRDYLNTQEEVLFMQVFVEEVGLWMDSMDPQKHVSWRELASLQVNANVRRSSRDYSLSTLLVSPCC